MLELKSLIIPMAITCIAGVSTGIGSLISLFIKDFNKKYLQFSLGLSTGVMVYVSFVELLASAIKETGYLQANIAFFAGIIFIMLIDTLIPHEYINETVGKQAKDKKLMVAGVYTMLGITIHNFPEGMAVFMSSLSDVNLGISLAFAIAIHNIPEGIAVAMPIYYATGSRKKAFTYSFLSGIAEPIGALIGILILFPFISPHILAYSLAFVAGIMVFISFDELLPLAYENTDGHIAIAGIITGMVVMAISLHLI
ncbi:MAG: hypothetical protein AUJ85_04795 [Elusimicrobia bacterium CG1_02_37_114]|nr:MAG: hypothetical protein AUJ85_04795 [Elusimicrobia bacterium CG1_02_37_114]